MNLMPPGTLKETARTLLNSLLRLRPTCLTDATTTYDPPSLAAGAVAAIQTITVTGAALGDFATASFSKDLTGIRINAWVSATDTVKFQFTNPTAGTIDLASGTVRVRVQQQ